MYAGAPELCNGRDDDCDSVVDADDDDLVDPPADMGCSQEGICAGVRVVCRAGGWVCDFPEGYEAGSESACDGVDNDCDGETDEGLTSACGTDVGQCEIGRQVCENGELSGCIDAIAPGDEACDDLDNDCDGAVDEDFDLSTSRGHCGMCGHHTASGASTGSATSRNTENGTRQPPGKQPGISSRRPMPWRAMRLEASTTAISSATARVRSPNRHRSTPPMRSEPGIERGHRVRQGAPW